MTDHDITSWHHTHIQECTCGEVFYAFTRSESMSKALRHVGSEYAWEGLSQTAERMQDLIP